MGARLRGAGRFEHRAAHVLYLCGESGRRGVAIIGARHDAVLHFLRGRGQHRDVAAHLRQVAFPVAAGIVGPAGFHFLRYWRRRLHVRGESTVKGRVTVRGVLTSEPWIMDALSKEDRIGKEKRERKEKEEEEKKTKRQEENKRKKKNRKMYSPQPWNRGALKEKIGK